jgi:hypothetical protein
MATYFVASGGTNTSPYDTWTKAATSLATALAAASSGTDTIVIQYNGVPTVDAELSADTSYTITADIRLISATNDGGSQYTPTSMGTTYWIGNSTTNRGITINGGYSAYFYGITLRTSGATGDNIVIASSDNSDFTLDNCYIWLGNTAGNAFRIGPGATGAYNSYATLRKCTIRFGNNVPKIRISATVMMEDCSISSSGSLNDTYLFTGAATTDPGGCGLTAIGCDFSYVTSGTALVGDVATPPQNFTFIQCKLGTAYTPLASQTATNRSSGHVFIHDCSVDDTHGIYGYANALGSMLTDTGIYYTGGSGISWKITTTSIVSDISYFETPLIDWYNTSLSSMTPRFEVLRDGSTSAYTNAQIWAEWFAKTTAGSTKTTFYTDRVALNGSAANQTTGAGLSAWTGESGTAWSGKLDSGSALSVQEEGSILGRVCVAVPNATLYMDPKIRIA